MRIDRDKYRANLTRYTRRALQALPDLNHPQILDIGCGSGIPSLELARLTNGKITGIDIDPTAPEFLAKVFKKPDKFGVDRIEPATATTSEFGPVEVFG